MLVGTVVVGSLSMMGASVRTQSATNDLIDGPRLADALVAEIMSMPYEDVDGVSGASSGEGDVAGPGRTGFDDVDDYRNWDEPTIQAKDGTTLPNATGWSRTANVWWASKDDGDVVSLFDTGLRRFTVTVTSPDGIVTERKGLRSRWGILQQSPTMDKIVVTQIEAALTLGTGGAEVQRGTNLLNHVEDPN